MKNIWIHMPAQGKKRIIYNKIILIPTDFSEVCENAVQHGIELAKSLKYKVCILHVIPGKNETSEKQELPDQERIQLHFQKCNELIESNTGVKIDLLVKEGNLFKVFSKVAREIKAGLMILGTPGKKGLQHLFGSHALRVVLNSPCPVIVVQKRLFGRGYQDIVLPVSSDIEPGHSVEWLPLMSRLFRSKIRLFQSLERDPALNTRLKESTNQIIKILKENNISFDVESADGPEDYSSRIISCALAHRSDLIMIMTMPREEIPGFNFSAWNEQLIFNEAGIPVMCFNPGDQNIHC